MCPNEIAAVSAKRNQPMKARLSYWNETRGGSIPTTVTNKDFDTAAQAVKYARLMGGIIGNYYIMPYVVDEDGKFHDLDHEYADSIYRS